MRRYNPSKLIVPVLMIAVVSFAGCAQRPSTAPEPSTPGPMAVARSTPQPPAPTNASPIAPEPGIAFGPKGYSFGSSPLPADAMNVTKAWKMLRFTYWLNSTAACFFIQNEAPAPPATSTGPAPSLTFASKSGANVRFAIPTQNVCGTTTAGGAIAGQQAISKDSPGHTGDWTVTIHGIGQNVQMRVQVTGA